MRQQLKEEVRIISKLIAFPELKPWETATLELALTSCGNKEIAARLHISVAAVKSRLVTLYRKHGISKGQSAWSARMQLVRMYATRLEGAKT